MNKHFFKILIIFTGMIALGLLGVFVATYLGKGVEAPTTSAEVAN